MKRLSLVLLAIGCAWIIGLTATTAAKADPLNDGTRTIYLYNCTGPTGTPTSFTIVKESGISTSFHLLDSTTMFVPVALAQAGDPLSWPQTDAFTHNGADLVTCNITRPSDGQLFVIVGFFTPAR